MIIKGYEIVQWLQHWSLINDAWHRDAVARRLADGQLRLISVPEEQQ